MVEHLGSYHVSSFGSAVERKMSIWRIKINQALHLGSFLKSDMSVLNSSCRESRFFRILDRVEDVHLSLHCGGDLTLDLI
jgi:hypothetical protein